MEPDDFYHDGSIALQREFGSVELAAHLSRTYVLDRLEPEHLSWIEAADAVYVASVGPDGFPDCSYKGGLPGFIRAIGPRTLEIPSYDGNGMYRSLGNVAATGRVGLLFLLPALKAKLRVNGVGRVVTAAADVAAHTGAEAVLRVAVRAVFENCPRYLHDPVTGEFSEHCPRPGYRPPAPDWKLKPEYEGLLPSSPVPSSLETTQP